MTLLDSDDDARTPARRREEERLRAAERERAALRRLYNAHRRREAETLVKRFPVESAKLATLVRSVRRLGPNEGGRIVKFVAEARWLQDAPAELRYAALRMLGRSLILRREALGLASFDDPLPAAMLAPGQPTENAFSRIRTSLRIA